MSRYLEFVKSSFTQEHFDKRYNYPYIAYSNNEDKVLYSDINYFYIMSLEDNNIVDLSSNTWLGLKSDKVEYSLDKKEWNKLTNITSYTLNNEQKIYFRSTEEILKSDYNNHTQPLIITSGLYNAGGDISTIMFGRENVTELTADSCLISLFRYTKIVSAEKLILPATRLSYYCYGEMFSNCTFLEVAPNLPAEYMAEYCYNWMFRNCTSLKVAPKLSSLNIRPYCYAAMFYQCNSLNTVQDILPATELAEYCYHSMFYSCTSLTAAPELPATTLAPYCYYAMFYDCQSLTAVPEILPATELAKECYSNMFQHCISLTQVPELPAVELAESCYSYMFKNCTLLTSAPELPATTLAPSCYLRMFEGCSSLTSAPELPALKLNISSYYGMFFNCSSLNYIKCLATDTTANNCTYYWVIGVPSEGIFVKHPNISWRTGSSGIPSGWTVKNAEI